MSIYASSDWHGVYEIWAFVKDFLKPDDKLIYLGDVTDRGHDGWKMLKEMLDDERIIYILGNHDQMMIDAITGKPDERVEGKRLMYSNGGRLTYYDMISDEAHEQVINKLKKCKYFYIYENEQKVKIFLSHSGSVDICDYYSLIWDRSHFLYGEEDEKEYDLIVHGHTPSIYLTKDQEIEPGAFWYDKKKIDIDMCSALSKQAVLLDLDTFDEEVIVI